MARRAVAFTILLLAGLLGAACDHFDRPSPTASTDGSGTLSGRLRLRAQLRDEAGVARGDSLFDEASGIVVSIQDSDSTHLLRRAITSTGDYRYEALPKGSYRAFATMVPADTSFTEIIAVDWSDFGGVEVQMPDTLELAPAGGLRVRPNPVREQASVSYSLATGDSVYLRIVSTGRSLVRELVKEDRAAGAHEVLWDGLDDKGDTLRAGWYWLRLSAGDLEEVDLILREEVLPEGQP